MKKQTTAALALIAFASVPLAAFAAADKAEVENYCSQLAMEENIAADKVDEYVTDCVAKNMEAEAEIKDMDEKKD
jgi:non-ribosomal peptide synthetase component E (peptide arylation enzyme)